MHLPKIVCGTILSKQQYLPRMFSLHGALWNAIEFKNISFQYFPGPQHETSRSKNKAFPGGTWIPITRNVTQSCSLSGSQYMQVSQQNTTENIPQSANLRHGWSFTTHSTYTDNMITDHFSGPGSRQSNRSGVCMSITNGWNNIWLRYLSS